MNGIRQEGLARFAIPSIAPNEDGPMFSGANFKPDLISYASGQVHVSWNANVDRDNQQLTYRVYRNGNMAHRCTRLRRSPQSG